MVHVSQDKLSKHHVIRVTTSQRNRARFAVARVTDWIPYTGILSLEIMKNRFKSHSAALKAAARLEQGSRKAARNLVNETSPIWEILEAYETENS